MTDSAKHDRFRSATPSTRCGTICSACKPSAAIAVVTSGGSGESSSLVRPQAKRPSSVSTRPVTSRAPLTLGSHSTTTPLGIARQANIPAGRPSPANASSSGGKASANAGKTARAMTAFSYSVAPAGDEIDATASGFVSATDAYERPAAALLRQIAWPPPRRAASSSAWRCLSVGTPSMLKVK